MARLLRVLDLDPLEKLLEKFVLKVPLPLFAEKILEMGIIGVFIALDLILFYVFWEIMLLPMFFLIGLWGGEKREYAAVKFFLYTFFVLPLNQLLIYLATLIPVIRQS